MSIRTSSNMNRFPSYQSSHTRQPRWKILTSLASSPFSSPHLVRCYQSGPLYDEVLRPTS